MRKLISLAAIAYFAAALAGLPATGSIILPPPRFRILFEAGVQTLPQRGPDAGANEAAIVRMAKAVEQIGGLAGVNLVFLASKPDCVSSASCDADRLTRQRVQEIVAALRDRAGKAGFAIPARNINVRFKLECAQCVSIDAPPVPAGRDALTLFLDEVKVNPASDICQAKFLLRDPSLPPLLDAPSEVPTIPLAAGARVLAGPEARLALAAGRPQITQIVWEDGKGRFRKSPWPAELGFHPIPEGAARLYMLPAQSENAEASRFFASLGESFAFSPRPSFLPTVNVRAASEKGPDLAVLEATERATGDNVRPVSPGTVRPRDKPKDRSSIALGEAPASVCQYDFAAAR